MSLTFDEARHFLSRTAFGGTPEEIRRVMQLDRAAAVAQALAIPTNKAQTRRLPGSIVSLRCRSTGTRRRGRRSARD